MTCIAQMLEEAGDALLNENEDDVTLRQRVESAGYYLRKVGRHICDWTPLDEIEATISNKVDEDDTRLSQLNDFDLDQMYSDISKLEERCEELEEEKEELETSLEALRGEHNKLFNEVQVLYGMFHEQNPSVLSS